MAAEPERTLRRSPRRCPFHIFGVNAASLAVIPLAAISSAVKKQMLVGGVSKIVLCTAFETPASPALDAVAEATPSFPQFTQRIASDMRHLAIGRTFVVPLGAETIRIAVASTMGSIRFSLRTQEPSETKARQGQAEHRSAELLQAGRDLDHLPNAVAGAALVRVPAATLEDVRTDG